MDTMDTTTYLVKKGYNSMILDLSSIRNLAIPDYPLQGRIQDFKLGGAQRREGLICLKSDTVNRAGADSGGGGGAPGARAP